MKKSRFENPYVLMSVLLILWGSFAAVSKMALESLDSYQVQFYMFGSSMVIFTLILTLNGRIKAMFSLSLREISVLLFNGLPFYLYYLFYTLSLDTIPVIEASMLNYLFPLFIVVLSVFMFGERLTPAKWLSLLMGFAGMVIIVSNGDFAAIRLTDLGGDLLAIGGALCWALFSGFGKKSRVDQDLGIYWYTLTAFVLSAIGLVVFSEFTIPDGSGWGTAVWLAVSNIVLGNILWFRGLKSSSSSLIASLTYLSPFATLLFIVVMLGERMSAAQLAGFLVILAGIAIQAVAEKIRKVPRLQRDGSRELTK